MRGLLDGDAGASLAAATAWHAVLTSFVWSAAIIAVFAPLAIAAYRRP